MQSQVWTGTLWCCGFVCQCPLQTWWVMLWSADSRLVLSPDWRNKRQTRKLYCSPAAPTGFCRNCCTKLRYTMWHAFGSMSVFEWQRSQEGNYKWRDAERWKMPIICVLYLLGMFRVNVLESVHLHITLRSWICRWMNSCFSLWKLHSPHCRERDVHPASKTTWIYNFYLLLFLLWKCVQNCT